MARYSLRMGIFHLKRNRNLKVIAGCLILLTLLYMLYTKSEQAISMKALRFSRNQVTSLVDRMGNYEPEPEPVRFGPGERGRPYKLKENKQNDAAQSISEYGMNMACSDEIAMDRSIPDLRLPECKHWDYPVDLPSTSVIIVFHNEGWSSLLRTVHSVLNRTPKQLLHEIVLVDDFSDKEHLKTKLDEYIERFNGKVQLLRNREREGLIRTRSRGAKEATGEVILFLDAHCEVGYNWLPPLLAPIYRDRKTMTVPVIDGIDHNTWEYRTVYEEGHHFRGIFEWGMLYKEIELPDQEQKNRKHHSAPYKSPTHAGGLFAIDRKYFLEIGGYDPGLLVWGGENFELSFKIWQCGGSIEWVPCSRVGHVYRGFMPYNFGKLSNKVKGPLITHNYKRVIEVWFDEKYKKFFYTREPLAKYIDVGDISQQLELKNKLQCKSFQWFMDNVAFDVLKKYPELPPNLYTGEVKNVAIEKCLDTLGYAAPSVIGLGLCHGFGNNQLFRLNSQGQLGNGERCVEADKQGVKLVFCKLGTVDGPWVYEKMATAILNRPSEGVLQEFKIYQDCNRIRNTGDMVYCLTTSSFPRVSTMALTSVCYVNVAGWLNKAGVYFSNHGMQMRDAEKALLQFKQNMKIYDDHKILDIGCGPGDLTVDHLLPLVPRNGKMVGVDLSPAMIQYANSEYCDPRLKFEIMDITNPVFSEKYKCTFNSVFSFYCLHWVQDQWVAMKNILDVLQNGGEAMLVFLASNPIYTLYEKLAGSRKWGEYMCDFKEVISPYHNSSDPEADVRRLLSDVGFMINDCVCTPTSYTIPNEAILIRSIEAVNPFLNRIPKNMVKEYLNDCKNIVINSNLCTVSETTGEITYKYSLITIHVTKPNNSEFAYFLDECN